MHLFSGRRRSASAATLPSESAGDAREASRRRLSSSFETGQNNPALGRKTLHGLFQRHDSVPATADGSIHANQASVDNHGPDGASSSSGHNTTESPEQRSRSRSKSLDSGMKDSHHHDRNPMSKKSHAGRLPHSRTHLRRQEVYAIFSGAPYFLLEKGRHDMWYPQIIFPWDDHDPTVQHLWDRKILPHPSYTLCTLHAHLPVPEEWAVKGDTPVVLNGWKGIEAPRRATFDVGIFEVPNMLSKSGQEPGTVGFRHFLELPVADSVRFTTPGKPRPQSNILRLSTLPAVEADRFLEHYHEAYSQCHDGTIHDRRQLLSGGPAAWKKIGLRDISLKYLTDRLAALKKLRQEILYEKTDRTILDAESMQKLHRDLFMNLLYPPSRHMLSDLDNRNDIKAEIKALTTVLATPGAWIDFRLVEWRLRIGQLLWESPPHVDGDFLNPSSGQKPVAHSALEQKWFLIQMLLAAELLLRLDAIVRVGLIQPAKDVHISVREIYRFDKLRTAKVDWDLVTVRRFLDSFDISWSGPDPEEMRDILSQSPSHEKGDGAGNEKARHFSFFESIARRHSVPAVPHFEPKGQCKLSPTHIEQQVHGLLMFAETIGWPSTASIQGRLDRRMQSDGSGQGINDIFNAPVRNALPECYAAMFEKKDAGQPRSTRRLVALYCPPNDQCTSGLGGWITRSWLSGFVSPGDVINHLLIATLVENDPDAMAKLGPIANLDGGFIFGGKSWWSQECIVGRVLSSLPGTKACMGWLSSTVRPKEGHTFQALDDTWLEVVVNEPPTAPGRPRINQGNKVSIDSTPLGQGSLTSDEFTLPLDPPYDRNSQVDVTFEALTFSTSETERLNRPHVVVARKATMSFKLFPGSATRPFDVSWPLTYDVHFIASHACRLPPGQVACSHAASIGSDGHERLSCPAEIFAQRQGRLPGHPLPKSYKYKFLALNELPRPGDCAAARSSAHIGAAVDEVLIVDARGPAVREVLARSWCAAVGYNAIISRTWRTCLSCCVREARALAVEVVIRIGDHELRQYHPID